MAIVTVSGLPSSSGKKNEVRDSIENLLVDLALDADSSLRQHRALFAKLSVTDELVETTQVMALNDFAIHADRKLAFNIAGVKTIHGALDDVAALYAIKKTIAGLGNEAVVLTDSNLSTIDLRALDKRTSGVINVTELDTLSGSLVDMTAVLKSKGIAGLANATLVLEQDAPLTAKNLKALIALAKQAAGRDELSIDISVVMTSVQGPLSEVNKLFAAGNVEGLDGLPIVLTDVTLSAAALHQFAILADGHIQFSQLKTLTGDAASLQAIVLGKFAGLARVNLTLSDSQLSAEQLSTLLAATQGKLLASKLQTLTGELDDIVTLLATPKSQIASLTGKAITLTDTQLSANQLNALNAQSTGRIDASSLLELSGSASELRSLLSTPIKQVFGLGSQVLSVQGEPSVADLNALDARTSGVISASITDTATALAGLQAGNNNYAIHISDAASIAQLLKISASTTQTPTYTQLSGSAEALLAADAVPWLFDGLHIIVTGSPTPEQLLAIKDAIGSGHLFYNAAHTVISGSAANDLLQGGNTADVIYGLAGNDTLIGNHGDDYLFGGSGDDNLQGFTGNDWLYGGPGRDTFVGGQGDDHMFGGDSAAGDGAQNVFVYHYMPGQGNDTIYGFQPGLDWLLLTGGPVNEIHISTQGDDALVTLKHPSGQVTTITLIDRAGRIEQSDIVIIGTEANDVMTGNAADNVLSGQQGDDTINGGAGSDLINGGLGNDLLYGGGSDAANGGRDTFLYDYDYGQGNDTIADFTPGRDKIALMGGTMQISISAEGADARITLTHPNAEITNIYLPGLAGQISLHDFIISGRSSDDILIGSAADETINGQAGDDILNGGGGVDSLNGGAGNDTFIVAQDAAGVNYDGGTGHDILRVTGQAINLTDDTLLNIERIEIADGASAILTNEQALLVSVQGSGSYTIGADPRVLRISEPDTDLTGQTLEGIERILIADGASAIVTFAQACLITLPASGNYQIVDTWDGLWDGLYGELASEHAAQILQAAQHLTMIGTTLNDVLSYDFEIPLNELILRGLDGDDSHYGFSNWTLMYGGLGNDWYYLEHPNHLVFENADEGYDTVHALFDYTLGVHVENLYISAQIGIGNALNNRIEAGSHNNLLYGLGGNDWLTGATGDDQLYGGDGDDLLDGGWDNDLLYGDAGNDWLYGDEGDDQLYGGDGDDVLHGGAGDDTLTGGAGRDVFLYTNNYNDRTQQGQDTITDFVSGEDKIGIHLKLASAQITASGEDAIVTLSAIHGDISIRVLGMAGQITLDDLALVGGQAGDHLGGDAFNNTILGMAGDDALYGAEGNDHIFGGEGRDFIDGGSGNDRLYGEAGNDSLYGAEGADQLYGGSGVDRFRYFDTTDSTLLEFDSIHDFEAGEHIDITGLWLAHTSVSQGSDTDLQLAQASATAAFNTLNSSTNSFNNIYISQVGANSYVFVDSNADQLMDENDLFIELLGVDATPPGFINFNY